ncbi:MAG: hypothetical protein L6Q71_08730 [Planctomycetes bacterium]|nr:hypothetical protein [Planctomycetota bacterium]NUQ33400.1 M50 family metallopeptidase [Planctomycetaceae bacterium]
MTAPGENAYLPGFFSRTIPLATLFGIKLRISISILALFAALAIHAAYTSFSAGRGGIFEHMALLLLVLALFVCMFLHELGHALLAALRGFRPHMIALSFVGMTSFERKDARPADEWLIAMGGPLVNLLLGAGILSFVHAPDSGHVIDGWYVPTHTTPVGLAWWIGAANLAIAVFNMLPLFPLDGSRVALGMLSGMFARRQAMRAVLIWSIVCGAGIVIAVAGMLFTGGFEANALHIVLLVLAWVTMSASVRAFAAMRVDGHSA